MAQLLVSQEYLRARSIISDNADFKLLTPIIELVQDIYIQPALGTNLYNQIKEQSIPPANELTAVNKTLLEDHIQKIMVLYIQAEAPLSFKYRFMNKGVMSLTDENAQVIDLTELKYITQEWKTKAELYLKRMIYFILGNLNNYPLYLTNNGLDKEQPTQSAFNSGMYLPETPPKGWFTKELYSNFSKKVY